MAPCGADLPVLRLGGLRLTWYKWDNLSLNGRLAMSTKRKVPLVIALLGVLASAAGVSACQIRSSEEPAAQGEAQTDEEEQQEEESGSGYY